MVERIVGWLVAGWVIFIPLGAFVVVLFMGLLYQLGLYSA